MRFVALLRLYVYQSKVDRVEEKGKGCLGCEKTD